MGKFWFSFPARSSLRSKRIVFIQYACASRDVELISDLRNAPARRWRDQTAGVERRRHQVEEHRSQLCMMDDAQAVFPIIINIVILSFLSYIRPLD